MFERIHIIIFLMIFVSCKTNSQQGNINKKTLYSDLDHEHSIPTEKFFSKIEVIPLETQEKSIIRGIDKIMEYQSCIYILDRRQKAVLIFDGHGKFISKINSIGRAPDEFYILEDIEINTFRNTLECLDPMGKILTYDLMGNYLSTIYLPHPPMAYHYLHVLNQDSILLYTNPTRDNDYTFRIFSRQQDTIITQFSKQKKIITGECKLDKQKYTFPQKLLYKGYQGLNEFIDICRNNQYIWGHINVFEYKDMFFSLFNYNKALYLNITNKTNKESTSYTKIYDDLVTNEKLELTQLIQIGNNTKYCFFYIEPFELLEIIDTKKQKNTYAEYREKFQNNCHFIEKLNLDSNSILVLLEKK